MPNIGAPELIILLVVLLLVFGPKRLPEMGRSVGRGIREFKDSVSGNEPPEEQKTAPPPVAAPAPAAVQSPPPAPVETPPAPAAAESQPAAESQSPAEAEPVAEAAAEAESTPAKVDTERVAR